MFQELQKDKVIRRRFEETIKAEEEGGEVEMGREKKTSMEVRRESEIQELLDRPRVMNLDGTGNVVRSPVDIDDGTLLSRNGSGSRSLTRRKFSVDVDVDVED